MTLTVGAVFACFPQACATASNSPVAMAGAYLRATCVTVITIAATTVTRASVVSLLKRGGAIISFFRRLANLVGFGRPSVALILAKKILLKF